MCSTTSRSGRAEFGTGRGAGSHEILGFLPDMEDLTKTREIWEDVIAEFPKMWMQDTYQGYQGKYWSAPGPRKILPKPYVKPHPPLWYAAGNTTSYEMAAHYGLGVLGFSGASIEEKKPVLPAYKADGANAEPIGAFVNDNVMITSAAFVAEDRDAAVQSMVERRGCRTCRATCSGTTTRFPTRTGRRSGPSSSPTRPSRRCERRSARPAWSSVTPTTP